MPLHGCAKKNAANHSVIATSQINTCICPTDYVSTSATLRKWPGSICRMINMSEKIFHSDTLLCNLSAMH